MWRFIVVTFGFLALAFYELSGGADYAPADNSIQARAKQETATRTATARPEPKASPLASVEELRTTRLERLNTSAETRFEVTLASTRATGSRSETVSAALPASGADKAALLTAAGNGNAIDSAVATALVSGDDGASAGKVWPGAIELFSQTQARQREIAANREPVPGSQGSDDIRYVTGNVVNMRSGPGTEFVRLASLSEGTEVAVLDQSANGWLMLRVTSTGEEGWMADWLVSDPAR